jgi:ribonucleotide reductase alpha subunit
MPDNETCNYVDTNGNLRELSLDLIAKCVSAVISRIGCNHLDANLVAQKVYPQLKEMNTYKEIEQQIVATASELEALHYDYSRIAVYIIIRNLHNSTETDFSKVLEIGQSNTDKNNNPAPIYDERMVKFVRRHAEKINARLNYERDYTYTLFGFRTLERAYLKKLRVNDTAATKTEGKTFNSHRVIERPQHMIMREAIAIHYRAEYPNIEHKLGKIFETYDAMSEGYFTHATPTKFNAGTPREQLSSCFLLTVEDDIEAIGELEKFCGILSKNAGGIGISFTKIRCDGSYIKSTQGVASGLRLLKIFNEIARYADQGGKRPGSIAAYIEPWHGDIFFFLDLKKNTGAETERARDLFFGLMINDIFMRRVQEDGVWSLMCPSECPDLIGKYGDEFTRIYEEYERKGNFLRQIKARDLWFKIMETQFETGSPYMVYKDHVNRKSNQINLGTINNSNLCAEIVEFTSKDEIAVCNLASICLPKFVEFNKGVPSFNYDKLKKIANIATRNLDNIIDINFYPLAQAKYSNLKHRPIGVGVQGLADVFALFKTEFGSPLSRDLNKKIFETIYFGCMEESNQLAKEYGHYKTFRAGPTGRDLGSDSEDLVDPEWLDSPLSQGKFQFDLWNLPKGQLSGMWDWDKLRNEIVTYGVRNSLTTTCMPTASTSQIMGNNECIEPYTSNLYTRNTSAGDYYVINKHLMKELIELDLWNEEMLDMIKYCDGSIADIPGIPINVKAVYKTVWEISQKVILEMSADRGPFIDQTQSLNLFMSKPDFRKLSSAHMLGWKLGLKTGQYYLRSRAAREPGKFGIDIDLIKKFEKIIGKIEEPVPIPVVTKKPVEDDDETDGPVCKMEAGCLVCGS